MNINFHEHSGTNQGNHENLEKTWKNQIHDHSKFGIF